MPAQAELGWAPGFVVGWALELEAEGELADARGVGCAGDDAEGPGGEVGDAGIEDGVVEDVEEAGAELQFDAVGDDGEDRTSPGQA
jgi:hypothetical protein